MNCRLPSSSQVLNRVDGAPCASSFQCRYATRGLNLVKLPSVLFTTKVANSGVSSSSQKQNRSNPIVLDSADNQKLAERVTSQDPEDSSADSQSGASSLDSNSQLLTASQLAALRADPIRSRLVRKLSEANQFNRHLLRQVQVREKVIQQSKEQISALEFELGVLVKIAQEIAKDGGKPGTRKIDGRYIHSHLAVRLEECVCALLSQVQTRDGDENLLSECTTSVASQASEVRGSLLKQLENIEGVRSREIECVWYGVAENVVVMGTFDNWSHGEAMSPETTGTFTKFSAALKLLPGRYEIKFQVDGEWRLSNFLPIVGEGPTMNNVLVVE